MSKKTSYNTTNGQITGKTVTERGSNSTTSRNYKASGDGWSRAIFGPDYKLTSKTTADSKGNRRTTKY